MGHAQGNANPKALQGGEPVRQESLATGLIDRGLRTVGYNHAKPTLACRDRRRQSSRTTANYKNVSLGW